MGLSYMYNKNPFTGKMASLYFHCFHYFIVSKHFFVLNTNFFPYKFLKNIKKIKKK